MHIAQYIFKAATRYMHFHKLGIKHISIGIISTNQKSTLLGRALKAHHLSQILEKYMSTISNSLVKGNLEAEKS